MTSSYLSLVRFYELYLRRCFASSGLISQTLAIDSDTTIHVWAPTPATNDTINKPALLLLHGFGPAAIWQWRLQVQALASDFRLFVPDLVFFGGSSTSSADRSEVFQADCVARLMDRLGVERFNVAGTSYGGFVAYHLARIRPERVEKVVIASSGVNMRRSDNAELVRRAKCDSIEKLMLPSTAKELRTLTGLAATSRTIKIVPDFFLNDVVHKLYSENRKEKVELLKGLTLGQDESVNLIRLQQDVLIIWGDQDQIFPLKMAYELKETIAPKARLEVIKNTSHVPQIEDATRFNKILRDFLSGCPSFGGSK